MDAGGSRGLTFADLRGLRPHSSWPRSGVCSASLRVTLDGSSGRTYHPCSQEQGGRTQGTRTPEPGWHEEEAQTVQCLCMSSFQLLVFPRRRNAGPERSNSGIARLAAGQRQDWGNDAHRPTSRPGPWSCLDLEVCWCPGHGGPQGCPREPKSLSGGGAGWCGGGQGTRNGVAGLGAGS